MADFAQSKLALKEELRKHIEWPWELGLVVNAGKTEYVVFHKKKLPIMNEPLIVEEGRVFPTKI